MMTIINKQKCSGCHACASACPKNCITMELDGEGFLYPRVDNSLCVNCGLCEKACPIIVKNPFSADVIAYSIKNKNEEIRKQSSSGGVFTVIAQKVLEDGGVVFGASFDENFDVKHICVDNIEDLSKLRGSKYLQSVIGDTYKQAKNMLLEGRGVYFTGTPCQIEGLLKYLGEDYDNLITSDIICHGVPSPKVWQTYLNAKCKALPKEAFHRNKDEGWNNFSVKIVYGNETYRKTFHQDPYMKAFLGNLCLRPSCYNCSFKTKNRASDITLADFWGIDNIVPEMNDDRGTSLVLVHTRKGKRILDKVSDKMLVKEVDVDKALIYNSAATSSVDRPGNRNKFMKKLNSDNFEKLVEKYRKRTFAQRVKGKIKRIIRKIVK